MKTIVTGGSGLLGQNLREVHSDFTYISSKNVNLCDLKQTFSFFDSIRPKTIIHLAAKVGGIKDNFENPYDFISQNNFINSNVIDYCAKNNVRLIFISSTCVYPKFVSSYPMKEEHAQEGEPEHTNSAYAHSKRFAKNLVEAANQQYNLKYTIIYFCNLYGPYDHFDENKSHIIPALIKKFYEAKKSNKKEIELWGTGKPYRQFMHARDAANLIKIIADKDIEGVFNFAPKEQVTIAKTAEIIKNVIGYEGSILFNGNLDGVFRKDVSSEKILSMIGEYKFIDLQQGIQETCEFFERKLCGN